MAFKIIITTAAELDIFEATDYYEKQLTGLGNRFYKEIISCFRKLESHPQHYSFLFDQFRSVSPEVFPYLIIYKITGSGEVIVYGVMHSKINPERIKNRTK